jgi:hypothetical protein
MFEGSKMKPHEMKARPTLATRLIILAAWSGLCTPAWAAEIVSPRGVVELFTSQGCSSCPPADRVLAEIAARGDTLALAWHVDYWDYIGWKDSFARPENAKRQRAYAASLGSKDVYTPQAIINGHADVVGSKGADVVGMLEKLADGAGGLTVKMNADVKDGVLSVSIPANDHSADTTLWMIYFKDKAQVSVERGELAGHTLDYTNIVSDVEMIGMVGDKPLEASFAMKDIAGRGYNSCALILQKVTSKGTPGPIVGAAMIRDVQ